MLHWHIYERALCSSDESSLLRISMLGCLAKSYRFLLLHTSLNFSNFPMHGTLLLKQSYFLYKYNIFNMWHAISIDLAQHVFSSSMCFIVHAQQHEITCLLLRNKIREVEWCFKHELRLNIKVICSLKFNQLPIHTFSYNTSKETAL